MLSDIAFTRPMRSPNQPKAAPPKAAPTRKAEVMPAIQPPIQPLMALAPDAATSAGTMLRKAGPASVGKSACS